MTGSNAKVGNARKSDERCRKPLREAVMTHLGTTSEGIARCEAALRPHGADIGKPAGRTLRTPIHEAAEIGPAPSELDAESEAQANDRQRKHSGNRKPPAGSSPRGRPSIRGTNGGTHPSIPRRNRETFPSHGCLADKAVQNAMGKTPADVARDEEMRLLTAPGDP